MLEKTWNAWIREGNMFVPHSHSNSQGVSILTAACVRGEEPWASGTGTSTKVSPALCAGEKHLYYAWQQVSSSFAPEGYTISIFSFFFFFFFVFLGPHPWHMQVPRLGVKSELCLWPTPQPRQLGILDPSCEASNWTHILVDIGWVHCCWAITGTRIFIFKISTNILEHLVWKKGQCVSCSQDV